MSEVQAFGVRAQGAIDFMRGKLPEVSLAWDDLAGPVHAKVFTVAGATSTAVVGDLHKALTDALNNGTTITEFRKQFDQTVAKNGWSYNGSRGWRTQIIFDANMRSAHMAGRWQQIWSGRQRRPFLQYRTAGDARVRPQHRRWNGIVRAVVDAFWATFYPPNGWGCRCTVRALTQAEVDARGLTVQTAPFPVQMRSVTKGDEIIDRVPVGVDAGWDHNVGVSWVAPEVALGRKLLSLPADLRDRMIAKSISPAFQTALTARWNAFQSAIKDASQAPGSAQIVGFLDGAVVDATQASAPSLNVRSTAVAVPAQAAADPALMAWPADLLDELPVHLRNYRAVLWDSSSSHLVVIPEATSRRIGRGRVPAMRIRAADAGPAKGAMEVVSLNVARLADLRADGFTLLVGRLPD